MPNAYIIEPPLPPQGLYAARHASDDARHNDLRAGDLLEFHMVLVGHALGQLALVLFAWQKALSQGLTKQRSPADLIQVDWLDGHDNPHTIWTAQSPRVLSHSAELTVPDMPPTSEDQTGWVLELSTPMRLQQQGQPLRPTRLGSHSLLTNLVRRVALVMELHAAQTQWQDKVAHTLHHTRHISDTRHLHWYDWKRYSSRQQQEMTLGGVVGQWHLQGPTPSMQALWPWLWLGQWLHVGKNVTMGMGAYRVHTATSG
jgi:hypothetical protein